MPRVLQFGLSSNLVIYLYGCNAFPSEEESNFYNFQKQRSFLFNGKMLVSINPNCFLPPKKKKILIVPPHAQLLFIYVVQAARNN